MVIDPVSGARHQRRYVPAVRKSAYTDCQVTSMICTLELNAYEHVSVAVAQLKLVLSVLLRRMPVTMALAASLGEQVPDLLS